VDAVTDECFASPVLNSPYEYPRRHWALDENRQPTGQGVMVTRRVRTGVFLGCSQYSSDQPCTNTRNLAARG